MILTTAQSRTGRGVRVAVVDSGVHADHPHVGGVSGGVSIGPAGEIGDDYVDRLGHGTAVAAAIREKAPACELLAVRVFDRTLMTTGQALVAAIEWSARQGVQLINLSLGTSNQEHAPALAAAVAMAAAHGAIVVSAAPQEGAAWLPGGLSSVIAVDVDWDCPRDECRVVSAVANGIRLSASGYPRPIPGVPPERNFSGLSFAVANATGLLALVLEERPARTIAALASQMTTNPAAEPFRVDQIDHVELFVPDRREAAAWYQRVLGLSVIAGYEHWAADPRGPLMISSDGGNTKLALFQGSPQGSRETAGFHRVAFRVGASGFATFLERLDALELVDERGQPVTASQVKDHGAARSIYFNDPFGHRLELTTYDTQ